MKNLFSLEVEHYSKYTLRWFAAAINAIGLVAFGVILPFCCEGESSFPAGCRDHPVFHCAAARAFQKTRLRARNAGAAAG